MLSQNKKNSQKRSITKQLASIKQISATKYSKFTKNLKNNFLTVKIFFRMILVFKICCEKLFVR